MTKLERANAITRYIHDTLAALGRCKPYAGESVPRPSLSELVQHIAVLGNPEPLQDFLQRERQRLESYLPSSGIRLSGDFDEDKWNDAALKADVWLSTFRKKQQAEGGAEAERPESKCSIRLQGEVWNLRYFDEEGQYPRTGNKWLGWLAEILSKPNHHWTVAELAGDPEHKIEADAAYKSGKAMDLEAVQKIKNRLEDIEAMKADTGSTEALEDEEAELLRQLKSSEQSETTPLKNAHNNIATQLRNGFKKLKETMPKLAGHLKAFLKIELPDFRYAPPPGSPSWDS